MKIGLRTPSIKKSFKARTTGKITRSIKKSVNPLYGKKGAGFAKSPEKSIKNAIYHKSTIGISDISDKLDDLGSDSDIDLMSVNSFTENHPLLDAASKADIKRMPKWYYTMMIILLILITIMSLILAIIYPVPGLICAMVSAFGSFKFIRMYRSAKANK